MDKNGSYADTKEREREKKRAEEGRICLDRLHEKDYSNVSQFLPIPR